MNSASTVMLPLGALADPMLDQSRTEHISATPTSHALTDSALRKSQALLEEMRASSCWTDGPQSPSSSTQDSLVDPAATTPIGSIESPRATEPVGTVTIPVGVLNMMADMWGQIHDLQEKVDTGAATCNDVKSALTLETPDLVGRTVSIGDEIDSLASTTDSLASSTASNSPSVSASQSSRSLHSLPTIPHLTPTDLQHSNACIVSPRNSVVRELSLMTSPLLLNRRCALPVAPPGSVQVAVSVQLPSQTERWAVRHSVAVSSGLPSAREQ